MYCISVYVCVQEIKLGLLVGFQILVEYWLTIPGMFCCRPSDTGVTMC